MVKNASVIHLHDVQIRVRDDILPFQQQHPKQIDDNWLCECALKPSLFNGVFFLARNPVIKDDVLLADYYRTDYATFMFWRKNPQDTGLYHIFASAVLIGSDNAMIMGRMASHTATAGMTYFPAGSIDGDDIFDGTVNYIHNMHREIKEETGIILNEDDASPGFYMARLDHNIALFRCYHLRVTSDEVLKSIQTYIDTQSIPELADIFAVHNLNQVPAKTRSYICDFIEAYYTS